MLTIVSDFERLIAEYESCPNLHEKYAELKNETRELDEFVLHDGYLFIDYKLCIQDLSWRILCLGIACR